MAEVTSSVRTYQFNNRASGSPAGVLGMLGATELSVRCVNLPSLHKALRFGLQPRKEHPG
jgi:hypothetical protein